MNQVANFANRTMQNPMVRYNPMINPVAAPTIAHDILKNPKGFIEGGKDVAKGLIANPVRLGKIINYTVTQKQMSDMLDRGEIDYNTYNKMVSDSANEAGIGINDDSWTVGRKVGGAVGGTALDVLTAGTMSPKYAAGLKTFKLGKTANYAAPLLNKMAAGSTIGGLMGAANTLQRDELTKEQAMYDIGGGAILGGVVPAGLHGAGKAWQKLFPKQTADAADTAIQARLANRPANLRAIEQNPNLDDAQRFALAQDPGQAGLKLPQAQRDAMLQEFQAKMAPPKVRIVNGKKVFAPTYNPVDAPGNAGKFADNVNPRDVGKFTSNPTDGYQRVISQRELDVYNKTGKLPANPEGMTNVIKPGELKNIKGIGENKKFLVTFRDGVKLFDEYGPQASVKGKIDRKFVKQIEPYVPRGDKPVMSSDNMGPIKNTFDGPLPKKETSDTTLFRSGDIDPKSKRGIFLSNERSNAENYQSTGTGGKTTHEYTLSKDAKMYEAENTTRLLKELRPDIDKNNIIDRYIRQQSQNGGKLIDGLTAEQRADIRVESIIKQELSKRGYDGVSYTGGKFDDAAGEYQLFNSKHLKRVSKLTESDVQRDLEYHFDMLPDKLGREYLPSDMSVIQKNLIDGKPPYDGLTGAAKMPPPKPIKNTFDGPLPKQDPLEALKAEARKYKSAEEFVKAQGEPLYHGTKSDFAQFDNAKMGSQTDSGMYGKGFYLTPNQKSAKHYAGEKGYIKEVYADMKNPYVINTQADIPDIKVPNKTLEDMRNGPENYSRAFTKYLKDKGYDGVIDNLGVADNQRVVFDANQLKTKQQLTDLYNQATKGAKSADPLDPRVVDYSSKPKEGTIRLYTNTKGVNVDNILKDGLKTKQRLQAYGADPSEGSVSWFETTPNLKGYGGNTVAVDVPLTARMQKVNDTQYMVLDDLSPEHIAFVDRPLFGNYRTSDLRTLVDKYGVQKTLDVFEKSRSKNVTFSELKNTIAKLDNQATKPERFNELVPKSYLEPPKAKPPITEQGTANIVVGPPKGIRNIDIIKEDAASAKANFYNRFDSIEKLVKKVELERGTKLKPSENPTYLVKQFLGGGGIANGKIDMELTPIIKQTKDFDGLRNYLVATRMNELAQRGLSKRGDDMLADLSKRVGPEEIAKFDKIAKELYAYQQRNLDELLEVGVLTPEQHANILAKNKSYIPFNRVIPDMEQVTTQAGQKIKVSQSPIKAIKGSDKDIIDPIESMIRNTYDIQAVVQKQKVLRSLTALAPDEFVPLKSTAPRNTPAIEMFVNGKRQKFETNKAISDALNSMNEERLNAVVKMMSIPAKMLRSGATSFNVAFALPNIVRDQLSAAVNSKYGGVPMYDFVSGLASVIKKDDSYKKWILSGADQASFFAQDRTTLSRSVQDITGGYKHKVGKLIKSPLELFRIAGEYSEKGSRVGVFKRAMKGAAKEGLTGEDLTLAAMRESREATIDFAQRGSKMKAYNALVPFLNARVQGTGKLMQSFKQRPVQTMAIGASIASVPAGVLYAYNTGDPERERIYNEIPEYIKREYFVMVIGDKETPFVKIPKGEVGKIFGNPVESFLASARADDPEWKSTAISIIDSFLPVGSVEDPQRFITDASPTAVAVPYQMMSNFDAFRKSPIISQFQKDLPPEQQYSKYNTETGKKIGDALNISPAMLEFGISGFTGGLGRQGLQMLDIAQGVEIPRNEMPVASRFLGKEKDLRDSANKVYEEADKARIAKARENFNLKKRFKEGDESVLEGLDAKKQNEIRRDAAEDQIKETLNPKEKALWSLSNKDLEAMAERDKDAQTVLDLKDSLKSETSKSSKKKSYTKIRVKGVPKVKKSRAKKGRKAKVVKPNAKIESSIRRIASNGSRVKTGRLSTTVRRPKFSAKALPKIKAPKNYA